MRDHGSVSHRLERQRSFRGASRYPSGNATCWDGHPKHICGEFLGAAIALGGQGIEEQAGLDEVAVIKLVE